ncbi:hypothetical protein E2C01_070102 [Portunus trituberculatus]|uniref:Uncharacterized protein n=1 Tax=Portunus trituberculatus TaxID=210409 RepID=A0A5B7I1C9_PORTR|nr:hypothetical protein [Portunus trituberculatus]
MRLSGGARQYQAVQGLVLCSFTTPAPPALLAPPAEPHAPHLRLPPHRAEPFITSLAPLILSPTLSGGGSGYDTLGEGECLDSPLARGVRVSGCCLASLKHNPPHDSLKATRGGGLSDTEFLDLLRLVPLRPATHRRDVVMGEVGGEGCCVAADGESDPSPLDTYSPRSPVPRVLTRPPGATMDEGFRGRIYSSCRDGFRREGGR